MRYTIKSDMVRECTLPQFLARFQWCEFLWKGIKPIIVFLAYGGLLCATFMFGSIVFMWAADIHMEKTGSPYASVAIINVVIILLTGIWLFYLFWKRIRKHHLIDIDVLVCLLGIVLTLSYMTLVFTEPEWWMT